MKTKNKDIYKRLQKLDEQLESMEDASNSRVITGFRRDLRRIQKNLEQIYHEYETEEGFNYSRFRRFKGPQGLDEFVTSLLVKRYVDIEKETSKLLTRITSTTINQMQDLTTIPGVGKKIDVAKVVNGRMAGIHWTSRYGVQRSKAIKGIQGIIGQGLKRGETYTTMSRQLTAQIAAQAYEVERVIRTEAHRCMNEAKVESFNEINEQFPINKRWVSASDERTREAHHELDGVVIPVEDNFRSSAGGEGPAPGQMNNAADDINCRCWVTMEFK